MMPQPAALFKQAYWTPEVEASVLCGQTSGAFQPASVQAEAINPDGSIVVGATGTLVIQSNGTPASIPVAMDFLVFRDKSGLRIASLYNRPMATAQAPQTAPY
jgi:hypothetical protein